MAGERGTGGSGYRPPGGTQITSAVFPRSIVAAAQVLNPAGEGLVYFIPAQFFPFGPVIFL
jgi:hypothetical protein